MATLEPWRLLDAGVHVTQGSDLKTGAAVVTVNAIMPDSAVLDPTPLVITTLALEQSVDDGLTWSAVARVGWQSDPAAQPLPGQPLPRPGLSTTVPNDGRTRRFRARLDIPQSMVVGLDVTVT